jgi:hypothetical protein
VRFIGRDCTAPQHSAAQDTRLWHAGGYTSGNRCIDRLNLHTSVFTDSGGGTSRDSTLNWSDSMNVTRFVIRSCASASVRSTAVK